MESIVIVGGGAAGMFASILLGEAGRKVTVLERSEKTGKKLYITGKGRCNFTNACSRDEFLAAVVSNPRFLYSAFDRLSPADVLETFEKWGLRTKVERGRRAFPASDKSADVLDMLRGRMKKAKVEVITEARVTEILTEEKRVCGVRYVKNGKMAMLPADIVLVATGGLSYPSTGSTGDGLAFAKSLGLAVKECRPSLVPFNCAGDMCRQMSGLSLKNVKFSVKKGKKILFEEFGEMLFTHFGVSGPLVLTASAKIGGRIGKEELSFTVDLKPAVTAEELDVRMRGLLEESPTRALRNALAPMYPASLLPALLELAGADGRAPGKEGHLSGADGGLSETERRSNRHLPGVDGGLSETEGRSPGTSGQHTKCEKKKQEIGGGLRCADVTKALREELIRLTKAFPLPVTGLRGYEEAVITQGGVSVKEIDPKTMACKKIGGLYFIGEVLDLDALTGGYNLQIAWSTAAQAAAAILAGAGE